MENINAADRIVRSAREWIGTPYQHQASLRGVGADCLGLVRGIWREIEGAEPEIAPPCSSAWSEVGGSERLLEVGRKHFFEVSGDAAPSDIIIFRMRRNSVAKHVGIVSGKNEFIHAYDGASVVENTLSEFWLAKIAGTFRFPCVHHEEKR